MTAAREVPDPWAGPPAAAHWVPARGLANGLNARAWGVLADLPESQVYRVLFALIDAGIAGYVLPVRATVLEPGDPDVVWRLRVDIARFRAAEDLLMDLLRYARRTAAPRTPQPRPARRRRPRVPLVRKTLREPR